MDHDGMPSALREVCAERLGADLAARCLTLARPGFALTEARPGQAAGHSRFGGLALLEPGTPWPSCEGFPLSLLAVLDTDALHPWLGGLVPVGTGLLNFFALDSDSELSDPAALELSVQAGYDDPRCGRVIAARADAAVETEPPARASDFTPTPWTATPGFVLPDTWDPAWDTLDPGPDVEGIGRAMLGMHVRNQLAEGPPPPGLLDAEGHLAFGRPLFPTGSSPVLPDDEDPNTYHHLLQLDSQNEWYIGGDGGCMHWSIPTEALRDGDFTRAIPTPDIF
ncbi:MULTISPECIES: DUF1963 domain-containing protein [unclassified Streptomyces]|uniref:DUF1963 domain-containing protein n=1 Tax=unclassified Streptomyces TaxID=2593676 RepID=UPI002DDBBF61|nr:DUF1963 domain-containing protein [Streptomyces sp. NBC_01775]WSB78168.1 YwqG family protein [Streptomyces sp. NBC_01775]WSS42375.1 YwqG family protein [Streptomyces sp. NBC_01187]